MQSSDCNQNSIDVVSSFLLSDWLNVYTYIYIEREREIFIDVRVHMKRNTLKDFLILSNTANSYNKQNPKALTRIQFSRKMAVKMIS